MKCAKVKDMLSDYADGLVSPRVHDEISAHIAECKSCSGELETTTQMLSAVSELGNKKAPYDLWPAVQVRIENLEQTRQPVIKRVLAPVMRPLVALPVAAAAAAGILMLVSTVHQPKDGGGYQKADVAAYVEEYSEFRSQQSFVDNSTLIVSQLEEPVGKDD